jgi:hypothetical protein
MVLKTNTGETIPRGKNQKQGTRTLNATIVVISATEKVISQYQLEISHIIER